MEGKLESKSYNCDCSSRMTRISFEQMLDNQVVLS